MGAAQAEGRTCLASRSLLGALFLVLQCVAWFMLRDAGQCSSPRPPIASFFYLLTGLHALHMLAGLVALAYASRNHRPRAALRDDLLALHGWHLDLRAARPDGLLGVQRMQAATPVATHAAPGTAVHSPYGQAWQKLMMWFFIVGDALLFAGFLASYGFARLGTPALAGGEGGLLTCRLPHGDDVHPHQQQRRDGVRRRRRQEGRHETLRQLIRCSAC